MRSTLRTGRNNARGLAPKWRSGAGWQCSDDEGRTAMRAGRVSRSVPGNWGEVVRNGVRDES